MPWPKRFAKCSVPRLRPVENRDPPQASRKTHNNSPISPASKASVISAVRPGRYTCANSSINNAAAASPVAHTKLLPDARHSHSTDPYQKLLRNNITNPACQVDWNNPRKGTQSNAPACRAAKWNGASSPKTSAPDSTSGAARRTQTRGSNTHAAYAAAAPAISDHWSTRLARTRRAGTTSNNGARYKLVFRLRKLSNKQAAASHSAKTISVSTADTGADRIAVSLLSTLDRPHTGNNGNSWYPSQQDKSSKAPDGRSREAAPSASSNCCNFTR